MVKHCISFRSFDLEICTLRSIHVYTRYKPYVTFDEGQNSLGKGLSLSQSTNCNRYKIRFTDHTAAAQEL